MISRKPSILGFALVAATATTATLALPDSWNIKQGPPLSIPRAAHQATLLEGGTLLFTGGCSGVSCSPVERSAELIDTKTGGVISKSAMAVARVAHAAAPLADGRVLVVGGWTGSSSTALAEAYDPKSRQFSSVGQMSVARMDGTATTLADGAVLVVGGASATSRPLATAELFNDDRFTVVEAMSEARAHHAAVRLADGRVLVVGGQTGRGKATTSAEIYDPTTRTFSRTGALQTPRCKHAAVLLKDHRVMVIAGSSDCDDRRRLAQTEIYDPATGKFQAGPALLNPRYKIVSAAAVTPEGNVVVAGDATDVEVWSPGSNSFVRVAGAVGKSLAFSTATPLPSGALLIAGGYDDDIRPTAQTWLVGRVGQPASAVR